MPKIRKIFIDLKDKIIEIETDKNSLIQSIDKEDIEELKKDLQDYFNLDSIIEKVEFTNISEDQEAYLLATAYVYTPNQIRTYTDSILLDNDRKLNEVIRNCLYDRKERDLTPPSKRRKRRKRIIKTFKENYQFCESRTGFGNGYLFIENIPQDLKQEILTKHYNKETDEISQVKSEILSTYFSNESEIYRIHIDKDRYIFRSTPWWIEKYPLAYYYDKNGKKNYIITREDFFIFLEDYLNIENLDNILIEFSKKNRTLRYVSPEKITVYTTIVEPEFSKFKIENGQLKLYPEERLERKVEQNLRELKKKIIAKNSRYYITSEDDYIRVDLFKKKIEKKLEEKSLNLTEDEIEYYLEILPIVEKGNYLLFDYKKKKIYSLPTYLLSPIRVKGITFEYSKRGRIIVNIFDIITEVIENKNYKIEENFITIKA